MLKRNILVFSTLLVSNTAVLALTDAPSSIGEQAIDRAYWVFQNAKVVHYEHSKEPAKHEIRMIPGGCEANMDCSGFVSAVLRDVAPKHYEAIRRLQPDRPYPQAKSYASFFCGLTADQPTDGWIGIRSFSDLRRGDIIAWAKEKKPGQRNGNSGHVMFVLERPSTVQQETIEGQTINFVSVRVLDSSSVYHFQPEELPPLSGQSHRDGVGIGNIRLVVDDSGRAIGYWEGTYWGEGGKEVRKPSLSNTIGFGRLQPLRPI